jgi:nicotinate-nucleotide adenylyltransferase
MKIGIFGGTFDPPHSGHLTLARSALEQLQLDEVLFLPANKNPLKSRAGITPGKHRLAMVQRLIQKEEGFSLSDMELTRGGVSYTVDTLGELQMVRPAEYWFLMGADALRGLPDWKNPQRLMRLCRLGVAVRPPMTEHDVMARVPAEFKGKVDVVKMSPMDVSSTDIRNRLARNQPVTGLVSPEVLQYIREQKLYKD